MSRSAVRFRPLAPAYARSAAESVGCPPEAARVSEGCGGGRFLALRGSGWHAIRSINMRGEGRCSVAAFAVLIARNFRLRSSKTRCRVNGSE